MKLERTPREMLGMIKRRKAHVIGMALIALLGAGVFLIVKPRSYESSTRIRVEGVASLDGRADAERLHGSVEAIKNSSNFDEVVTTLGLDAHLQGLPEHERNAKRKLLIDDLIRETEVTYSQPSPGVFLLTITHASRDPDTCFRVVNELAKEYRDQRLSDPIVKQERVVESKVEAEGRAQVELDQTSEALEAFDKANSDFIGDGLAETLDAVRREIESIEQISIASLETDLKRISDMLADEPEMIVTVRDKVDKERLADVERDIRAVEKELDRLTIEERKLDKHPKVMALKRTLSSLLAQHAEILGDVEKVEDRQPNPMHAKLREALLEKKGLLDLERRKLAILRQREAKLREDSLHAPEVLAERDRLVREQRAAQLRLEDLKEASKTARDRLQDLRSERQLQFDVIDAPTRPNTPSGPAPFIVALMGLAMGIGTGVGLAFVLDSMDHSFREVDDAAVYLGAPSLGAIHIIETPPELAKRRRKTMLVAGVLVALGLVAAGVLSMALFGDPSDLARILKR